MGFVAHNDLPEKPSEERLWRLGYRTGYIAGLEMGKKIAHKNSCYGDITIAEAIQKEIEDGT